MAIVPVIMRIVPKFRNISYCVEKYVASVTNIIDVMTTNIAIEP